jgi:HEAT repeat protein
LGITYTSVCVRCGVEAPELGDFGYVGIPSASATRRRGAIQTFGFIYAGLAAIDLLTEELERFKAFLDEHAGHPIHRSNDIGSEDFDEDPELDEVSTPRQTRKFKFKARNFVEAFYELHCTACSKTYRSNSSDRLRAFEARTLTKKEVGLFLSHVAALEEENFYRVFFPFEEVSQLAEFLERHGDHGVQARRYRGERKKTPRGLAQMSSPAGREVPSFAPGASERALGPVTEPEELALLVQLRHRDPERRAEAARTLGRSRKGSLLGYLVSLQLDPDPMVRAACATAIGELDDSRKARPLGHALLDEAEMVRDAARTALRQHGIREEDALAEARAPRGPYDQEPPAVGKDLESIRAGLRDPRGNVRYKALERLEKSREPGTVDLLLLALADPSGLIRGDAAKALVRWKGDARVPEALLTVLDEYGSGPVRSAVGALGELHVEAAVPRLGQLLLGSWISYFDTTEALRLIGTNAAAEALAEALSHPSEHVRAAVVWRLGQLRAGGLAGRLITALSDSSEEVRAAAMLALQEMKSETAVEALAAVLERPSEWDRSRAVSALGKIGGAAALQVLIPALKDESGRVRGAAAAGLETMNEVRGNEAILAAAGAGDGDVAANAWRFLLREGNPETEEALAKGLSAAEYEIASEMAGSFLQCGNSRLAAAARAMLEGARPPKGCPKIAWGEGTRGRRP